MEARLEPCSPFNLKMQLLMTCTNEYFPSVSDLQMLADIVFDRSIDFTVQGVCCCLCRPAFRPNITCHLIFIFACAKYISYNLV